MLSSLNTPIFALVISVAALLYAVLLIINVMKKPTGTTKMWEISKSIQEGAKAYLNRQSLYIFLFAILLFAIIVFLLPKGNNNDNVLTGISFLVGAFFSGLAGYIGMNVSVRANVRTTEAAKKGLQQALTVAFRGGSITGLPGRSHAVGGGL